MRTGIIIIPANAINLTNTKHCVGFEWLLQNLNPIKKSQVRRSVYEEFIYINSEIITS